MRAIGEMRRNSTDARNHVLTVYGLSHLKVPRHGKCRTTLHVVKIPFSSLELIIIIVRYSVRWSQSSCGRGFIIFADLPGQASGMFGRGRKVLSGFPLVRGEKGRGGLTT